MGKVRLTKLRLAAKIWLLVVPVILAGGCTADGASTDRATVAPTAWGGHQRLTPGPGTTRTGLAQAGSRAWTLLRLPDTGQVKDYTPVFGEDGDYALNPPAYRDNGDGTVSDEVTGLIWQQRDGGEMTFDRAVSYCQGLTLGGRTDWRLPSSLELFSIVDHDRNPAINTAYFPATGAEYWWTATEQAGDATRAWVVNAGGGIGAHPKNETISAGGSKRFHARCVRNVPAGKVLDYVDGGDGTVADRNSGLVWEKAETASGVDWEGALKRCEGLGLGGRDDWRLPNVKELRSISDDARVNPPADPVAFPGLRPARYWSSTTLFGRTTWAWFVDFSRGLVSYDDKKSSLEVRCVRGG